MKIKCEKFIQNEFKGKPVEQWDLLIESALQFAGQIDEQKLINISHSVDINGIKSVFVWYRHYEQPYLEGEWRENQ